MHIPMKTASGECKCGTSFSYRVPAGIKDPTLCEACVIEFQRVQDQRRRRLTISELATACGISEKYRTWDSDYAAQLKTDVLLEWVRSKRLESIWIGGTNGIGKTHTVMFRAYEMLDQEGLVTYAIRASSWLREIVTARASDDRDNVTNAERRYNTAKRAKLLIVDDIGKERLTEPRAELLYELIDERDRSDLPIWFTTNFTGNALRDRLNDKNGGEYGHAILKRLGRMIPALTNRWPPIKKANAGTNEMTTTTEFQNKGD